MANYDDFAKSFSNTRHTKWGNVSAFIETLPKYSLLYDVGSGNGKYADCRKDLAYIGLDISSKLLACALEKHDRGEFIIASAFTLPFRSKSSHATICIAVLHHFPMLEQRLTVLKELIRVSSTRIHFTVWAAEQPKKAKWIHQGGTDYIIPWQNTHHRLYHLFTEQEVKDILSQLNLQHYTITFEENNWCVSIYLI